MFELSPAVVGLIMIGLGLGFVAATLIVLRIIPRPAKPSKTPEPLSAGAQIPSHQEAVLLIESGGRVSYINQIGREFFNIWNEDPNLENLARRTRPNETFLELCASEGQSRFTINGQSVEGTSYFTPGRSANGTQPVHGMLVTIRKSTLSLQREQLADPNLTEKPEPAFDSQKGTILSHQAVQIITELSQTMASHLDLEPTLQTILESVERLMPSDFLEITLWDEKEKCLTPYRLVGLPGIDRKLEKSPDRYQVNSGYSGYLISEKQPLLVKDVSTFRTARPAVDRQHYPFQSYVGVPLILAGNLIGTLEFASLVKENYHESDLEILTLLSKQAAIAINNALLYEKERLRSTELAGLAQLAQSISAIEDPQDLFHRLIESVIPLMPVEVLGFLIYDENRHILRGQPPFQGILDSVVEWYQTTIAPDSRAEEFMQSNQPIVTEDATQDQRFQLLDLHHLAQASGIRHAVLFPLSSGGQILGFLLAAKKLDRTAFDSNDIRLLAIIAGQAAPIIENAALVQLSRQRANRAETLRRIASLTGSNATLEEIIKFSLIDLARLLQADTAAVYLLDEDRGELRLHRRSTFGIPPEFEAKLDRIPAGTPEFEQTATATMKPFLAEDFLDYSDLPPTYQPLFEFMRIRSAIGVPLIAREQSIGEMVLGSLKEEFFQQIDLMTITTAASQLAVAIERFSLTTQTDQSLRQRVEQLTAVTQVSRELNRTLDLKTLLQRVYDEILKTTRADCGTILLFEQENSEGSHRFGLPDQAPEFPGVLLYLGDAPGDQLHPLEREVLSTGEACIIADFEARSDNPPISPAHAGIRSALILPIAYQGQIAGIIHLHAREPDHFGPTEQEIGEALAIQAAIAFGNALRYQDQIQRGAQLRRRIETLSNLLEVSQVLQAEKPIEFTLDAIAHAIQASTPFQAVLISLIQEGTGNLERVASAGISNETMAELREHPQSWEHIQSLLIPMFQMGRVYFIPGEKADFVPPEVHTVYSDPSFIPNEKENSWHPDDLLLAPLLSSSGKPLGMISVDAPRDHLRPDQPTLDTLEIFSTQAGLVIENQIQLRQLKKQITEIENQLDLARETAKQAQQHLPFFLHKDLEQTLAVQQLSQRYRRLQAGLQISSHLGGKFTQDDCFVTLGEEIITLMGFDLVLIVEPTPGGLNLRYTFGSLPGDVNPTALLGQRNPLRSAIQFQKPILVSNLSEDEEWLNTPLLRALETRSFICVPVLELPAEADLSHESKNAGTVQAVFLAINQTSTTQFTEEDEQLFGLISRQLSAALRNLRIVEITHNRLREVNLLLEFSQSLGILDPVSILHTLVEIAMKAVPSAQTAMVALWDSKSRMLIPQAGEGYSDLEELKALRYQPEEGIPGQVFQSRRAINLESVDFAAQYNLSSANLYHYRNATAGRLAVSSLAVPIMAGSIPSHEQTDAGSIVSRVEESRQHPLGVLALENAVETSAFTPNDLAIITSLAQQTALTLENASLYQASEQRSHQLQALTLASSQITSSLEKETLVTSLLDQLSSLINFDTATLWLRQQERGIDRMVIHSARGFEDSDERIGLTVDVVDSQLMDEMIRTEKPIWVPNVKEDPRFQPLLFDSELSALLENENLDAQIGFDRLSWLGVPLIASGHVMGVIALEKEQADFYSEDDIRVTATFAAQAAAGIENSELYQESVSRALELARQSQTLSALNRLSADLSGSLNADRILTDATREFLNLVPSTTATAIVYLQQTSESGVSQTPPQEIHSFQDGIYILHTEAPIRENRKALFMPGSIIPRAPIFDRLQISLGIFQTEDAAQEDELKPLETFLSERQTKGLLMIPIMSGSSETIPEGRGRFHGLLIAHHDQNYRYEPEEIELARTIANQVATALQNARLFEETRTLTEQLELRVQQRTAELAREHRRSDTLLKIITELSASLDLNQVLDRTLHVLGEYVDAQQISILIDRPGQKELERLSNIERGEGFNTREKRYARNLEQLLGAWIIQNRQPLLVDDVSKDDRWSALSQIELPEQRFYSVLGVPLMSGAEALGCLILLHSEQSYFDADQLDLVRAAANQVSISVNNAELYRLIRDQAEDLGSMLRNQQIETSRSKAILEAVADGVLVTDAHRQITLFNESAEKILGLNRGKVLGKSMDHFAGLFGSAAQSWLEKISSWSQDSTALQAGDTYAEQITLEDGRVISVHLAPVSLRNDFLGTVSIFQDITHQVEVDRLKSEFVATVSHELRTPLTSIKGYVEILLMGAAGQLSDQQTHFLQVVKGNTERLSVLVNDLLDISQIEAGRVHLSIEPTDLSGLVERSLLEIQRRMQGADRKIVIEKDIPAALPKAKADPDRIRRVLDNLLDNAYQYNLPGGTIYLRLHQVGDEIQIDIQDSGIGINLEDKEQVFERFYRGENPLVLGVAGTGLGLSIVKNIIQMHQGRIWVESSGIPGEGSTFSFTLPVANSDEMEKEF